MKKITKTDVLFFHKMTNEFGTCYITIYGSIFGIYSIFHVRMIFPLNSFSRKSGFSRVSSIDPRYIKFCKVVHYSLSMFCPLKISYTVWEIKNIFVFIYLLFSYLTQSSKSQIICFDFEKQSSYLIFYVPRHNPSFFILS